MFDFVKDWGPESLLALVVLLFIMGWLTPKYLVVREIKNLKEYHEARIRENNKAHEDAIKEIQRHHEEVVSNLRTSQDVAQQALTQAVHNNQRLVGVVDDLTDLARVATPALVARQDVLEGRHDP